MQSTPADRKKLLPLRRFASDIYAPAYLSLLVQRGKLKAQKIGRNYFTTGEWFGEYLERHAREEKREIYLQGREARDEDAGISAGADEEKAVKRDMRLKAALAAIAVFLLFGIWSVFYLRAGNDRGVVAGVEERAMTTEMMAQ